MSQEFRREYLLRLPLPLAQLYSRAYNAKDARGRHDNAFYLCEALVKLAAAPLIACYLDEAEQGAPRSEALDRLLAQLALPSLGQWLAMLRELARRFGGRPDAAAHPLGQVWGRLNGSRADLPGLLALYRRFKNGVDGAAAGDQSCSPLQAFDALLQYRNGVFGHGGPRFPSFYEKEMGPLLFPAVNDLLAEGTLEVLGPRGGRLVQLTELRTLEDGRVEVGLRELTGLQGERLLPLALSAGQAVRWVRRQPAQAAAYGLLLAVLVLGVGGGGATWLWLRAEKGRGAAVTAKGDAEAAQKRAETAEGEAKAAKRKLTEYSYADRIYLAQREWYAGRLKRSRELLGEAGDLQKELTPGRRPWEWDHLSRVFHPELAVLEGHTGPV